MNNIVSTPFCPQKGCILFDLDGTLLDSALDIAEAGNQLFHAHDQSAVPFEKLRLITGEGAIKFIELGFGYIPEGETLKQLKQELFGNYENLNHKNSTLYSGVTELLTEINIAKIPWGIVTNKSTRLTLPLLELFPILKTAQILVCADTLEKAKPHPEPLLHACQALFREAPYSLYIGDHERDMCASHAAGLFGIVALYGYIHDYEHAKTWPANYYVQTIAELHTLLRDAINQR